MPHQIRYAAQSELLHHSCLLERRRIGWLNLSGDIDQSKYNILQLTSIDGVIKTKNTFSLFYIALFGNLASLKSDRAYRNELKPEVLNFLFSLI